MHLVSRPLFCAKNKPATVTGSLKLSKFLILIQAQEIRVLENDCFEHVHLYTIGNRSHNKHRLQNHSRYDFSDHPIWMRIGSDRLQMPQRLPPSHHPRHGPLQRKRTWLPRTVQPLQYQKKQRHQNSLSHCITV